MGPHPVFSAVVLLLLLLHPLLEHLLDLLLGEQLVKPGLLLVPVGIVPQDIRTVQPVQQLLRHLLLKGHVLEVLEKTAGRSGRNPPRSSPEAPGIGGRNR